MRGEERYRGEDSRSVRGDERYRGEDTRSVRGEEERRVRGERVKVEPVSPPGSYYGESRHSRPPSR